MNPFLSSLVYVLAACFVLWVARHLFVALAKFHPEHEIKKKNHTATLAFGGYLFGIVLVLAGAFIGPSAKNFTTDFLMFGLYALVGLGLMGVSILIANKVLLYKFDNTKELLEDGNIGTAAVHFSTYVASGLVIAACVNGDYGGILSTLGYYVLDMVFLFLFINLYNKIVPYDVYAELEKDNFAVGISLAGHILAIGIILMKSTLGTGHDWLHNLTLYFIDLSAIVFLLPSVKLILDKMILTSIDIDAEIQQNNVAAALIEFIFMAVFALILFFMIDFTSIL